jgi:CD48 antigen
MADKLYALAMVFWQLVTREEPYDEMADNSLIRSAVKEGERDEIPEGCPSPFAEIIKRGWAQLAKDRPKIDIVVDALQEFRKTV